VVLCGWLRRRREPRDARIAPCPPFINYPQFWLDGKEWMMGWTDYPGSDWGKWKNTNTMAVSTLDGDHELVIRQRTFLKVWDRQFKPLIASALRN